MEESHKEERERKTPLGRFPSWPNAAPRTFLDRVFGSQEGSNMIHGGTKKGVECSKIFDKMIKPPPPYMQTRYQIFFENYLKYFWRSLFLQNDY